MSVLTLLWKFREYIMAVLIVLMIFGYWFGLKHTISKDNKEIAQLTQEKADLQGKLDTQAVLIKQQNDAVDQMKKYADQKDREIADATNLAEKMQDTVDTQAQQLINSKTNIDQTFTNLTGCQAELDRIRTFMFQAEQSLTNTNNGTR